MDENELITMQLVPRARRALSTSAMLYGQSETDTANQALQFYGWLAEQVVVEGARPALRFADGRVDQVRIWRGGSEESFIEPHPPIARGARSAIRSLLAMFGLRGQR